MSKKTDETAAAVESAHDAELVTYENQILELRESLAEAVAILSANTAGEADHWAARRAAFLAKNA